VPQLPEGITPEIRNDLHAMFMENLNHAMECLADAELGVPATAGMEVNPDGSVKNWGCKEDGLRGEPACRCILDPILENEPFAPSQNGYSFIHVYK